MKTIHSHSEDTSLGLLYSTENTREVLNSTPKCSVELQCNSDLLQSYNILKSTPKGHKGQFYQRILSQNGTVEDIRSQSMPNSLDENYKLQTNLENTSSCDTELKFIKDHDGTQLSSACELWFKTWPERCDKTKNDSCLENTMSSNNGNTQVASQTCDISLGNGNTKTKFTLNEALQNISLAYSPVTKQLHLVDTSQDKTEFETNRNCEQEIKTSGHKRTNAGSFSSTISSISDPSTSGSLLDPEERSLCSYDDTATKSKKKTISNFFTRNVFTWKSHTNQANGSTLWKFFGKSGNTSTAGSPQHQGVIASSTALIQHVRPPDLPAKAEEEEQRHREEYKAIIAAAKKKEVQNTANRQKLHKLQLQQEEQLAAATKHFTNHVLPNWDSMYKTRKTRELWWQGLPSSVRGKVWRMAIGNELNLTPQLYEICLSRAQNRLNSLEPCYCGSDIDQESSMDVIQLDIARTFPHLGIFQEGGPYSDVLHCLLAAYVCYRPDVGYVQGMSYIAAILLLNMEHYDAFICFANLIKQPLHTAAFTLNQAQMQAYYNAYNEIFNYNLPKLYIHFQNSGLTPDLYLLDWIYTIFAKAMPLDIACRVWDIFLRDGDEFIFRTALGILHLNQDLLMHMDFLHGAQFLTRLPDDLSAEQLFKSIQAVNTNAGKQTFNQIVDRYSSSLADS